MSRSALKVPFLPGHAHTFARNQTLHRSFAFVLHLPIICQNGQKKKRPFPRTGGSVSKKNDLVRVRWASGDTVVTQDDAHHVFHAVFCHTQNICFRMEDGTMDLLGGIFRKWWTPWEFSLVEILTSPNKLLIPLNGFSFRNFFRY